MRYKEKHFYLASKQVEYMLYEEKLDENEIHNIMIELWGSDTRIVDLYISDAKKSHNDIVIKKVEEIKIEKIEEKFNNGIFNL